TRMREVTLPLIRPGLFAGWLLVFVPVIQELSASILLFSSSSITLAVAVYNLYETGYFEPAAALSIVNMVIIGVAILLAYRIGGRSGSARGAAPGTTEQQGSVYGGGFCTRRGGRGSRPPAGRRPARPRYP